MGRKLEEEGAWAHQRHQNRAEMAAVMRSSDVLIAQPGGVSHAGKERAGRGDHGEYIGVVSW
jgi:hypothetical protein